MQRGPGVSSVSVNMQYQDKAIYTNTNSKTNSKMSVFVYLANV